MEKVNKFILMLIIVFLVTALFTGCGEYAAIQRAENSDTDIESLENYKMYLQEYPQGKHVEDANTAIHYITMRLAITGYAFNENPPYNSKSPESCKIFIIGEIPCYDTVRIIEHAWNAMLPLEWRADTVHDASLFCFIKEGDRVKVSSNIYNDTGYGTGGWTVDGYRIDTLVEIRQATTGRILFSTVLKGSDPIFPYYIESSKKFVEGYSADYAELEAWLKKVLF